MRNARKILVAVVLSCTLSAAFAADDTAVLRRPPTGSIASQLRLKSQLKAQAEGTTLAATINHNRQEWESLSPDQRDEYRRNVVAFLNKSTQEQETLLKHYDELVKLSAQKQAQYRQRAKWLKEVIDRLSPQERQALLDMPAEERARLLLDKRDELIKEGVLKLDEPAIVPSSAPAVPASAQKGS